jgi:hypothetical protein
MKELLKTVLAMLAMMMIVFGGTGIMTALMYRLFGRGR